MSSKLGRNPFQAKSKTAKVAVTLPKASDVSTQQSDVSWAASTQASTPTEAPTLAAAQTPEAAPKIEVASTASSAAGPSRSYSQARRANQPLSPRGQLAEGLTEMHPLLRWALVDLGAEAYMTALKGIVLIGGALKR